MLHEDAFEWMGCMGGEAHAEHGMAGNLWCATTCSAEAAAGGIRRRHVGAGGWWIRVAHHRRLLEACVQPTAEDR
jgi:hypothetical protein